MKMTQPTHITVTAQEILDFMLQSKDRFHNFICHTAITVASNKSDFWFQPNWQNNDVGYILMEKMTHLLGIQFHHDHGRMAHGIHTFMSDEDMSRIYDIGYLYVQGATGVSGFIRANLNQAKHFLLRVGILVEILRVDPECSFQVCVDEPA